MKTNVRNNLRGILTIALAMLLACCVVVPVLADPPPAGSLSVKVVQYDYHFSWTEEAGHEIWVGYPSTEMKDDADLDSDDIDYVDVYRYVHFDAPNGTVLDTINLEGMVAIDNVNGLSYQYTLETEGAFEFFLDEIAPKYVINNIYDALLSGVAMYAHSGADMGAGAMIDLRVPMEPRVKLVIEIYDMTCVRTTKQLSSIIQEETARVINNMQFETLEQEWCRDAYSDVEICFLDSYDADPEGDGPMTVLIGTVSIDVKGLAVSGMGTNYLDLNSDIGLYNYYVTNLPEDANKNERIVKDGEFLNGTKYQYSYSINDEPFERRLYHCTFMIASNENQALYLTMGIDCTLNDLAKLAQEAYDRVTIK